MKIKVYYEDKIHPTILEVPDSECEIWVEDDYQRRLAETEDKTTVERRTAQEIMDEDYNKPTFNNHHAETRRHVSLEALNADGNLIGDSGIDDLLEDHEEEYRRLREAIKTLLPEQQEMIREIYFKGRSQKAIADEKGITEVAVSRRMSRIYESLKKILS